jgi:hypothetical protein
MIVAICRGFKIARMAAFSEAISRLSLYTNRKYFASPRAAMLGLGIVWAMNALNNRPSEGRGETELMKYCLPLKEVLYCEDNVEDADGQIQRVFVVGEPKPHCPYGAFFFRGIDLRGAPHLPAGRAVSFSNMNGLLDFNDFNDFVNYLLNRQPVVPKNRRRRKNNVQPPKVSQEVIDEPDGDDRFDVEAFGYQLISMPSVAFPGETVEDMDDDREQLEEGMMSLNKQLKAIWLQFLVDIPAKCPFGVKGDYLRPAYTNKYGGTEDFFKCARLRVVFHKVRIDKKCNPFTWRTAFETFFTPDGRPPRDELDGPCQYNKLPYFQMYKGLALRLTQYAMEAVQMKLWELFDELYWMARNDMERPWLSKSQLPGDLFPKGEDGPSVGVRVNPKYRKDVNW